MQKQYPRFGTGYKVPDKSGPMGMRRVNENRTLGGLVFALAPSGFEPEFLG